ncbi:alpha/beta fold hydrolase [Gemmatimonas sp.]|uniref:alpha/beta fold hydrolase n=1 Tax=Gemmatimonas sp. TaxID=1962908 RepID=UPI003982D8FE
MSGTTIAFALATSAVLLLVGLVWFTAITARRVERALPPTGQFIEVNGARIHYFDRGQAPVTLLLVHGLGGNAMHFTHSVVDRLARDFRVVVMDRPGSGYSTRADHAAAGPVAQAEIVAAFIRVLGLDRPVLVGHSLGGAISLAVAVAHPTLVRGLALIAPLTLPQPESPAVFQGLMVASPRLRSAIGWTVATPLSIARRAIMLDVIFGPEAVPADFALAGGGLLGMRPSAFVSASTDLMAVPADMPRLVKRYATLQLPISILYGTHDRILDPALHGEQFRALLPHVQLDYVEGAGHMLPLTVPERVVSIVREVADRAR